MYILINILGNLPNEIWCDDADHEHCIEAFQRFCPRHFIIDKVMFVKSTTWPVCQFRVHYKAENGDLPVEGDALETLVKLILDRSPGNCFVIDRFLIEKERVILHYGQMTCEYAPGF